MKKGLKKILAVVLTLALLLCSGASLAANAYYIEYGESGEFEISGIYYGTPGETTPFDVDALGVEDYEWCDGQVIHSGVGDFVYDDEWNIVGLEAYQNGVAVINVYFYDEETDMMEDKYYLYAVSDGEDLGELTNATAEDIDAKYREEGYISINLEYETEETPYYCVLVDDLNSPIYMADEYYYADFTGSGSAIVYVIDAEANVFTTEIEVNVNYTILQWIIRIFFFGWLWW